MGISIPICSCIKNNNEENESEFTPEYIKDRNKNKNNPLLTKSEIKDSLTSPRYTPSKNNINFNIPANVNITFAELGKTMTFNSEKLLKLQTVIRGNIFRKKFFESNGMKELLKHDSDEIIKKKESEFISENLMEVDAIIKKNFNDNFLNKLQLKKSNRQNNTIRTDCLLKKNTKGELGLYRGELDINGNFNGYGELYLKTGKKYEGKFVDGKLNGYGRLIDLFGIKCYEGNFQDNQLMDGHGKIIEIKEDGSKVIYEGDIENMKKQGKGIEKKNDSTYMGFFNDDLKHGKGKVVFNEEDSVYEGDFNKGKMTGSGVFTWKDKTSYDGEFLDGKMHGKGLFKWPDGTEYEGDYVNNLREGLGEYRWKNGKKFKGMFKGGKQHGKGVYILPNGEVKNVEYNEGKLIKKNTNKTTIMDNFTKSSDIKFGKDKDKEFTLK